MSFDEPFNAVEQAPPPEEMRFAVILEPNISPGAAVNAGSIVVGALRSDGFSDVICDLDATAHAGILWNLVVLKAKTVGQIQRLVETLNTLPIHSVIFTKSGQQLSNRFEEYRRMVEQSRTRDLEILAIGLYGRASEIRRLTKAFSVFQ